MLWFVYRIFSLRNIAFTITTSLSTYLVIEQTLMRNINSTGGLSRDIGKNVVKRLVWVKSMSFSVATYTALCKISPASLITLASNT